MFENKNIIYKLHIKLIFICYASYIVFNYLNIKHNKDKQISASSLSKILLIIVPLTAIIDIKNIFKSYNLHYRNLNSLINDQTDQEYLQHINYKLKSIALSKKNRIYEVITTIILSFIGAYNLIKIINCFNIIEHGGSNNCKLIKYDVISNTNNIILNLFTFTIDNKYKYLKHHMFCSYCSNLPFNIFLLSLTIYHQMEYMFVAKFHYDKLSWSSYLLNQSKEYAFSMTFAILEYLIEDNILNIKLEFVIVQIIGFLLLVIGQLFRILAEFTAGRNFTHQISIRKLAKHKLVKDGVYKYNRHPSYFGFFYWAIGTQILCMNYISIIGFFISLVMFFRNRIYIEELYMIRFFGSEYIEYRNKTNVFIPCKF